MGKLAAALLSFILCGQALAEPSLQDSGWPFPPPDPKSWWDDPRPAAPEAADPLGGRRLNRGERLPAVDNGVEPAAYRLWGLQPLQTQVVRGGEMILEVWVRPSRSVQQSVIRVVVRRDGEAFVQARAGLACCDPGIARRVGFDAQVDPAPFRDLAGLPVWDAPRDVQVDEGGGASEAVCVGGAAFDLTLVVPGRARSLRRACDDVEVGQVAAVLEPVFAAALGREPRFDVLFPRGADFSSERAAFASLTAAGGGLKPAPENRAHPPSFAPPPDPAPAGGSSIPNP